MKKTIAIVAATLAALAMQHASAAAPAQQETPSVTKISPDELNKLSKVGMPIGKLYAVKAAYITGERHAGTALCNSPNEYVPGFCRDAGMETTVDLYLDQDTRGRLYDARGMNGTYICALVTMNGNRVKLIDFRPGACPATWDAAR